MKRSKSYRILPQIVVLLALILVSLACGSSSEDEPISTLVESSDQEPAEESDVEEPADEEEEADPAEVPPTDAPAPTPEPEIEGLIKAGTHLVGTDIEPGVLVGVANEGLFESCYWARLSGLSGSFDDLIANDNAEGLFYVEIMSDDIAFETACPMLPIELVPPRDELLTTLPVGTYLIGRDIASGLYRGETGVDESCYWSRLSGLSGSFDDLVANDNAEGQYYVEIKPDDVAFQTSCELLSLELVPPRDEFLTILPVGTYIVGRDIESGLYRGEAGPDESCYWARLSGISGEFSDLLANDNPEGQYFIEVLPTDYALLVSCEVEKAE